MKTFHQKIFLFIPGIALGIWTLFFLTVLPDVSAADPTEIHCPEQGFQTLPERISPLAIAYDRLRAVLSAHGNPKTIPFVLPSTACALSDPLSLPWQALSLTEQTGDLASQPGSHMSNVSPREIMRRLVLKAATAFSLTPDLNTPMEFSPY